MVLVCDGLYKKWTHYDNLVRGLSRGSIGTKPGYGIVGYEKYRARWEAMMSRCEDPTNPKYIYYGGRGVEVSPEFRDCLVFVKYIVSLEGAGSPGRNHLDRIDNDKGYCRGNLRWVTPSQNNRNTRRNRKIEHEGTSYVFADFVEEFTELPYDRARKLIKKGLSAKEIIEYPYKPRGRYRKRRREDL
jgi:hypothetical protein